MKNIQRPSNTKLIFYILAFAKMTMAPLGMISLRTRISSSLISNVSSSKSILTGIYDPIDSDAFDRYYSIADIKVLEFLIGILRCLNLGSTLSLRVRLSKVHDVLRIIYSKHVNGFI